MNRMNMIECLQTLKNKIEYESCAKLCVDKVGLKAIDMNKDAIGPEKFTYLAKKSQNKGEPLQKHILNTYFPIIDENFERLFFF